MKNQEALVMSEDLDPGVQDWFKRSIADLPREPFTLSVLASVRRSERERRMKRYAALLVASASLGLLLPELFVPLNTLAALPLTVLAAIGEQWPMLVLLTGGVAWWLVRQARNTGFLRRG
jgi:hypothetical protein